MVILLVQELLYLRDTLRLHEELTKRVAVKALSDMQVSLPTLFNGDSHQRTEFIVFKGQLRG